MELYSENENYKLYKGNMLDMLEVIEPETIDSIITDPPYELNFMSKGWDNAGVSFQPETWQKCYEVLKPGGYLLAFGGSRTFHRIACAIEDAGFEIRDTIMWLYGSGFPKSMSLGKVIEGKQVLGSANVKDIKKLKGKKEIVGGGWNSNEVEQGKRKTEYEQVKTEVEYTTELGKKWKGWGTALKPSFEPIIVARKPFKGSLVDNVIEYGVGGINIDECRVGMSEDDKQQYYDKQKSFENTYQNKESIYEGNSLQKSKTSFYDINTLTKKTLNQGRFPANTILTYDETDFDEVCGGFPYTKSEGGENKKYGDGKSFGSVKGIYHHFHDSGSASRYFMNCKYTGKDEEFRRYIYTPKASKKDRDEGTKEYYKIIISKEDFKCEENMAQVQLLKKVIYDLEVENLNILEYGKNIMVIFPKECKSIILTGINKITELKTWNLLIHSLIKDYTVGVNCEKENGGNRVENVDDLKELKQIITSENQELVRGVSSVVYQMLLKIKKEENWQEANNSHCTVKPTELMQYLVRLVNPNGATILDPFNGSGSTGKAVMYENKERNKNYKYIGIELTEEYLPISKARIEYVCNLKEEKDPQMSIFDLEEMDGKNE